MISWRIQEKLCLFWESASHKILNTPFHRGKCKTIEWKHCNKYFAYSTFLYGGLYLEEMRFILSISREWNWTLRSGIKFKSPQWPEEQPNKSRKDPRKSLWVCSWSNGYLCIYLRVVGKITSEEETGTKTFSWIFSR